ncbi:NAD/NADP-dependent octopine/nopaline dehydrogenase family protein [Ammoniphilus sp. YIM 78166]|uniref:NAD/NADP-dependent octopine/nopaline dehydrogenase family protein n=1 Tax=Ammoniphilus sp. YIM 78166 TaxID=1644106 RepID=UPI0010705F1D|nr:NAD/NADP-dependent octopine/nopaline dehydrogenase family protein [Ammoniphilus sp. YIM 78166]
MKFAIIGAGNGGQSMAAHMTFLGHEVSLYDIQVPLTDAINEAGGIRVEGVLEGFAEVRATNDLAETIQGADAIMVTTTATAHKPVAQSIAPYLVDGQVILIFPGYWGAMEFVSTFKDMGMDKDVVVAETESLIYTCRAVAPGHVNIRKIKEGLEFAALPSQESARVMQTLGGVYPQLIPAASVIRTTLNNVNPVFHVPILLMNAGRVESPGDFYFYPEGASPSVVHVIEQLDQERINLGKALDIELDSSLDLLRRFYQVKADTLYEGFQNNPAYKTGKAPTTLNYRYIYEDIPYGLIPMSALGKALQVETPCTDLLIDLAAMAVKKDLRSTGAGLKELGLEGMTPSDIKRYLG